MNRQDINVSIRDNQLERFFHDLILTNKNTQKDLFNILGCTNDRINLIHEDKYINGITSDFTLIFEDKIQAIIECKAGNIGVTDYVRGIGQVLQYEYFYDNNISNKGYSYSNEFKTVLLMPSTVVLNKNFNIANFKYPTTTILVEINEKSHAVREITQKELEKFKKLDNNLISISQYYVRDTRIFEIYMALKYICYLKIKGTEHLKRKELEEDLQKTNTINNKNWRNVFISLSSLGFIDSNNMPTNIGLELGLKDFKEFALIIYNSYLKPYIDLLNEYLCSKNNITQRSEEIVEGLQEKYNGNQILFLTQSRGRYISSWLNILRDDYGILDFESKTTNRKINYNIHELNNKTIIQNIKKYSIAVTYIDRLKNIMK